MVTPVEAVLLPLVFFNPLTTTWPNEATMGTNNNTGVTGESCSPQNFTTVRFNNIHCTLDRLIEVPVDQLFPQNICLCSGTQFDNFTMEIWELHGTTDGHGVTAVQSALKPTVDKDNVGRPMTQYCAPSEVSIPAGMAEVEITFAWRDEVSYMAVKGFSSFQQCRLKGKAAFSSSIITSSTWHLVSIASFAAILIMLNRI